MMQYNPEDSSEHHTRRRENLKSHKANTALPLCDTNNYSYEFPTLSRHKMITHIKINMTAL